MLKYCFPIYSTVFFIISGVRRMTNRARMWYVPLSLDDPDEVQKVPQMTYSSPEAEESGRAEYEKQKADRLKHEANMAPIPPVLAPYSQGKTITCTYLYCKP